MAQFCICFVVFLAQLISAESEARVRDVTNDASVLLQTNVSLAPRRNSISSLFSIASSQKQSARLSVNATNGVPAKMTRPDHGKGATEVTFGMQPKAFYGMNMKKNLFTIDVVLALKWTDKRTISKIPKGAKNVTLSQGEAESSIWMPQISITDRQVHKLDVISTAVVLQKTGEVLKIQRVVSTVLDDYQDKEFPFDEQSVVVKIASTQYMLDELVLTPDNSPEWSGVQASVVDGSGFELSSWKLFSYKDLDGLLQKSRGVLDIKMQRTIGGYINTHMIPAIFTIALACTVFYMPFIAAFVTPRLTVSIVSLLIFTNMQGKGPLPEGHANTWSDILDQNITIIMAIAGCFNVYTEILFHSTNVPEVASKVCNELKIILPVVNALVITIVFIFGSLHGGQMALDIVLKVAIFAFLICYVLFCQRRAGEALRAKKEVENDGK